MWRLSPSCCRDQQWEAVSHLGACERRGNVGPKVRPFCGPDFSEKSMSRDCASQAFFAKIGSAKRTQNRGRFSDQKCVAVGMNLGACRGFDFAEFDMRSFAAPRAAPRFIRPIPKRIEAELVAASAGALVCLRPRRRLYRSFSFGLALIIVFFVAIPNNLWAAHREGLSLSPPSHRVSRSC